ncbi:MAG: helix-turn-helix transcriptional regulator [Caldilineaceae bacterium]
MKRFGEKLRYLRNQRGISLRQLATELGLSVHGHIAQIERGERKPSADLIVKIARFFDVSADRLMMDELEVDDGAQGKT